MTVQVAIDALELSKATLHRIEAGQTSVRSIEVEAMCRLYSAPPELTEALSGLAKETRAKGWWHSFGDVIPRWFQVYVGLESAAARLRKWEPDVIPGLLQTRAYAREVSALNSPESDAEVERRVAVRLERQALLTRRVPHAPHLGVVLSEVALRRGVRDDQAMDEQLRYLIEVTETLPNVEVRVVPLSAGVHCGVAVAAFTILEFPFNGNGRVSEPPIVYSESLTGALYLDKSPEVAAYDQVWNNLVTISLDPSQSKDMITSVAKEYVSS